MANPKIINETPISMAQVKEALEKIKARDNELNFRANKTQEYLDQFVSIDAKTTEEITKKINKLAIPRLKENHIYKIIDLMPETVNELKILLQGYSITVSAENMKKIAEIIEEYSEKIEKKKGKTEAEPAAE